MTPFSGWAMPIQYQGLIAEHLHTRENAGLFDLSHMGRLSIDGPDAARLIQQATTNDAERLKVGSIQYSLMCNERGGVREDLLVYQLAEGWLLVVNASNRETVLTVLATLQDEQDLAVQVRDETFTSALLGLQGPESPAVVRRFIVEDVSDLAYYHAREFHISLEQLWSAVDAVRHAEGPGVGDEDLSTVLVSRTGYTGEDGFEIKVDAALAPLLWDALLTDPRVHPIGLGARDTLRLEAGMALYGHELTESITPFEARLGRVVRFDKGPFVGRDALAALREREPDRLLVGLDFEPGVVPRAGFQVVHNGAVVGEVASGTFSPTLRHPIATAYVQRELAAPGGELSVAIRGATVPARVVSLPFVPHHTRAGAPRQ